MALARTIANLLGSKGPQASKDRRLGGDRRRRDAPAHDGDDRRFRPERRQMRHGVQYSTARSMAQIEDWLDEHCDGNWNVVFDDIDADSGVKTFTVMFELEIDKDRFRSMATRS